MFVKERGLKPEMSAKEFYALFDSVSASPIDKQVECDFEPTHMDTMLNLPCQVQDDERGVHHIVWANGMTGSHPPTDTTFVERFVRLPTPRIYQLETGAAKSDSESKSAVSGG
jgi:hypothetical protein